MYRERKWVRNPKHRKYKPGEEEANARSLRNDEEEARGQEEVQGNEEQQPEEGDG